MNNDQAHTYFGNPTYLNKYERTKLIKILKANHNGFVFIVLLIFDVKELS